MYYRYVSRLYDICFNRFYTILFYISIVFIYFVYLSFLYITLYLLYFITDYCKDYILYYILLILCTCAPGTSSLVRRLQTCSFVRTLRTSSKRRSQPVWRAPRFRDGSVAPGTKACGLEALLWCEHQEDVLGSPLHVYYIYIYICILYILFITIYIYVYICIIQIYLYIFFLYLYICLYHKIT